MDEDGWSLARCQQPWPFWLKRDVLVFGASLCSAASAWKSPQMAAGSPASWATDGACCKNVQVSVQEDAHANDLPLNLSTTPPQTPAGMSSVTITASPAKRCRLLTGIISWTYKTLNQINIMILDMIRPEIIRFYNWFFRFGNVLDLSANFDYYRK